ncbi:hypothetical protein Tco_0071842 [Tanacetum coccineum]
MPVELVSFDVFTRQVYSREPLRHPVHLIDNYVSRYRRIEYICTVGMNIHQTVSLEYMLPYSEELVYRALVNVEYTSPRATAHSRLVFVCGYLTKRVVGVDDAVASGFSSQESTVLRVLCADGVSEGGSREERLKRKRSLPVDNAAVVQCPILALPEGSDAFVVYSDASQKA